MCTSQKQAQYGKKELCEQKIKVKNQLQKSINTGLDRKSVYHESLA